MSVIGRALEKRSVSYQDVWSGDHWEDVIDGSAEQAMRLSAVWRCVSLLSSTVADLPWKLYTGEGADRRELPAPQILTRPSVIADGADWRYAVMVSLLFTGNAYGLITRRELRGYPAMVELVSPDRVQVRQEFGQPPIWTIDGQRIANEDMWHLAAYRAPGLAEGLSPLAYARQTLQLASSAQTYARDYYKEGGHPTAILTGPENLTRDQAEIAKARFKQATKGGESLAALAGVWRYQSVQVSPADAAFLDAIRATDVDVCRFFGVPPEMIGAASEGKSLTYANRDQRTMDYLVFTAQSWIARLERSLSALRPIEEYVKANVNALLRSDAKTRSEVLEKRIRNGTMSPNEWRALEDEPPLPNGDVTLWPPYSVNGNSGR